MSKLLPVLIILAGIAGGFGAGLALRPAPPAEDAGPDAEGAAQAPLAPGHADVVEIVRMSDQFAVPVMQEGLVKSLVVLSLGLEMARADDGTVAAREARLRDRFLQVLFDHANSGGFEGNFTRSSTMTALRTALFEAAREVLGDAVAGVLITDIYRRDV